ncbi:hypothetical protein SAMN05421788_103110 [Filimonas lacunae]|uniref:Uncharacterized protein n=1 Tax=Filimonas lacunae TaxID=477680 RepID=A0A173MJT7_9BACT|nr:hypothetical protein [Filimonas lacunae]BAV07760.1 hypothetical protein FLA_3791 [Filimonas lacunae]SIT04452.1 hypothetical protein SAMN05421788_103110 [Filimonas lacunae]
MEIEFLRLNSLVDNSIGIPYSYYVGYIYTYYLQKLQLEYYSFIVINHIDDDLNEGLFLDTGIKGEIGMNVRMPFQKPFDSLEEVERSIFRLNVIHEAMLKLANNDSRFSVEVLEQIKSEILRANFIVDIPYWVSSNKKKKEIIGAVIVNPKEREYTFYFVIAENGIEKQRTYLQSMEVNDFYIDTIHFDGAWQKNGSFFLVNTRTGQEFNLGL